MGDLKLPGKSSEPTSPTDEAELEKVKNKLKELEEENEKLEKELELKTSDLEKVCQQVCQLHLFCNS